MSQAKFIITVTLITALFLSSCKTKSECPAFDDPTSKQDEKNNTKYKLILLKDDERVKVGDKKSHKKANQHLFKKKMRR